LTPRYPLKGVDRRRRRRIARAVRRGQAVSDPDDAALAVAYSQYVVEKTSSGWTRVVSGAHILIWVAVIALPLLHYGGHIRWSIGLVVALSFFVLLPAWSLWDGRRRRARAVEAERRNLLVMEAFASEAEGAGEF